MVASHWLTERDLDKRLLQCHLGCVDHWLYRSGAGDPLFAQCSSLHMAVIANSVRKWELRRNRVNSFQVLHAVSPHRLSQRYTETWGNPTVAQQLPEPIIHDSSNTRTTRCMRRQTQMWLHRSIHTIKGSNPSTKKSATDSFWPMEHHSTGRRTGLLKLIQVLSFCSVALATPTTVSTNQ